MYIHVVLAMVSWLLVSPSLGCIAGMVGYHLSADDGTPYYTEGYFLYGLVGVYIGVAVGVFAADN